MNKIRFFDGGMGTMLQAAGLLGPGALPEPLNLTHPEEIAAIHQAYADAGAEFISTNTFGANGLKFDNVEELVQAATALVRRTGKKVVLDIGPLGKLLQPMGELAFDDAYDLFARTIRAGAPGADLVLIETMSDTLELKAAVLAAKENCDLPVFTTMIMDEKGRLLTGADIETAVTMLEGLGVDALGFNCSMGPDQMLPLVAQLREAYQSQLAIQQNDLMRVFTIVTVLFLPLTLITGWFGMNFVNMPELQSEWGYPVIIAASILLVAGLLWFFRHKKWL